MAKKKSVAAKQRKSRPARKHPIKGRKKKHARKWVSKVSTVSTFPPEGTFNKDAETIARVMASKKVSPKGLGSGIKMVQYFINRGGKNLPAGQKRELEKAKRILQKKSQRSKSTQKS